MINESMKTVLNTAISTKHNDGAPSIRSQLLLAVQEPKLLFLGLIAFYYFAVMHYF